MGSCNTTRLIVFFIPEGITSETFFFLITVYFT